MGKNYFDQFDETPAMQLSPPAGVTEVAPPGGQGFISLGPVGTLPPRSVAPTVPGSISTVAAPANAPSSGGGNYFDRFDLQSQPPALPAWPDWMTGSTSSIGPNGLPDWMTASTSAPTSLGDVMKVVGLGAEQNRVAQTSAPDSTFDANNSAASQVLTPPMWNEPIVAGEGATMRTAGGFDSLDETGASSQQISSPYHPFFAMDDFAPPAISGIVASGADSSGTPANPENRQMVPTSFGAGRDSADFDDRIGPNGTSGIDIWNPPPGGYSLYTLRPNGPPSYGIVKGNVVGTTFSGPHDIDPKTGRPNVSAYANKTIDPNSLGVSLPYGFPNPRPGQLPGILFRITSLSTGKSVVAPIVDKGPHEFANPFWKAPPPPSGVYTSPWPNHSRLDMTPATARALGLRVKESLSQGPMLDTPNKDEIFYIEEAYPLFNDPYENRTDSPIVHRRGSQPRRRNPSHR